MRYRAALIGCGRVGSGYDESRPPGAPPLSHAGAYAAHPAYDLAGVADPDPVRLAACQARWAVPRAMGDFRELLDRVRPDVVSIATPPQVRLATVEAALACGARALLCEKPLAASVAEGKEIVARCEAAGAVLAVNYTRRWEAGCRRVRDLLRRGAIGPVQRMVGVYVRGLANNGGHLIDLVRWWCGEVVGVEPGRAREPLSPDVRLVCQDGTPADLVALDGEAYDVFELDVFARNGRVSLRDFGRTLTVQRAALDADVPGFTVLDGPEPVPAEPERAMTAVLDDLARCLATGGAPACTGADGLAVLEVLARAGVVP